MMEPHRYDTVEHQAQQHQQHASYNDHDLASNTEVEDSLMGDEKHGQWGHQRLPRTRTARLMATLRSYRWIVDTALLAVILLLLVRDQVLDARRDAKEPKWEVGGDFTGVRKDPFPQRITRFQPDQSYAPMNTSEFFRPEVLDKWNKLMPKGMGFVWVNDTHRYHDLPTPIEWPEKTVFTTSVTHHLHCLFAIVQTYSGLTSGHQIPGDHHWHMIHCFDYMRQAIMCSADIALEGHATTFPEDNSGSDGWDSKHVCKDYGAVMEYLEGVRAYDDQLIY